MMTAPRASGDPEHPPPGVALETSKRKFNQLLEKLTNGNSSRISLSSTRSSGQSIVGGDDKPVNARLIKRPRTIASINNSSVSLPTTGELRPLSTRPLGPTSTSSTTHSARSSTNTARPPPNYTPWSQPQFLARLKTFADVKLWTPKPDEINEVEWAKRGWICEGINTVACKGGCEQRVVVALRPKRKDAEGREIEGSEDYSVDVDDELVKRYKEIIVTGHDEHCLWRIAGCKEDIFRIPLANSRKALQELEERYKSFLPMVQALPRQESLVVDSGCDELVTQLPPDSSDAETKDDTPSVDGHNAQEVSRPTTIEEQRSSEAENNQNPQSPTYAFTFSPDHNPSPLNITAFLFATYGWKGYIDSAQNPTAHCETCFRRIGLWLYTKPRPFVSTNAAETEPLQLNLLEEHREYCPWKNVSTQAAQGTYAGLAGWKILRRVILSSRPRKSLEERRALGPGAEEMGIREGNEDGGGDGREGNEKSLKERWKRIKGALNVKRKVKK